MLTEDERRRLAAMERHLRADDPGLDHCLRWLHVNPPAAESPWSIGGPLVLIVIGVLGVAAGLATVDLVLATAALLPLVGGVLWLTFGRGAGGP